MEKPCCSNCFYGHKGKSQFECREAPPTPILDSSSKIVWRAPVIDNPDEFVCARHPDYIHYNRSNSEIGSHRQTFNQFADYNCPCVVLGDNTKRHKPGKAHTVDLPGNRVATILDECPICGGSGRKEGLPPRMQTYNPTG